MNLMPIIQYDYGLWYVKGGMYNLAVGLGKLLDDLEIPVRFNSEVASINQTGNLVQGVTLTDGDTLSSDYVVCNMEVLPAYRKLLSEPPEFMKKLKKFEPACSRPCYSPRHQQDLRPVGASQFLLLEGPEQTLRYCFPERRVAGGPDHLPGGSDADRSFKGSRRV